jgi:predicted DNA binding CopG/RHH family protein
VVVFLVQVPVIPNNPAAPAQGLIWKPAVVCDRKRASKSRAPLVFGMTSKGQTIMFKKIPALKTNQQTEDLLIVLTYRNMTFQSSKQRSLSSLPKNQRLNMRLPSSLLEAVKKKAKAKGLHYQRYIRATLEKGVGEK